MATSSPWGDFGGALPGVDPNSKAPIYDITAAGGGLMNPMLRATLDSAKAGGMSMPGVQAFLGSQYRPVEYTAGSPASSLESGMQGFGAPAGQAATTKFNVDPLVGLAKSLGYDTSGYNLDPNAQNYNPNAAYDPSMPYGGTKGGKDIAGLYNDLNDYTKDYVSIGGLSAGWNPTGDWRGRDQTLYKNVDGKLTPVTDSIHDSAPKTGGWIRNNQELFMALMAAGTILTGGLAAGAAGAAGAGTTAATTGGATATGATGATAAGGTAAATGAGATGISGGIANALGLGAQWGSLTAAQQAAILGAAQGGISGGLNGGGWEGALKGAALGGISGGVGSWGGGALSSATGLPAWASKALVSAGLGGGTSALTGGDWKRGALGSGLGSLASTGLSGAGVPGELAGKLGGMAGGYGANALLNSSGSPQTGSGGVGMGQGVSSGSGGTGRVGTGLSGGWRSVMPGLQQQSVAQMYAPLAAEAQRAKLIEQLKEKAA